MFRLPDGLPLASDRRDAMPLAPTLQHYLSHQGIAYDVIPHEATLSSTRTAEACHVSGDCLAKGSFSATGAAICSRSFRRLIAFGCPSFTTSWARTSSSPRDGGRVVDPRLRAGRDPACGCLLWARDDHRRELGSAAGGLFRGREITRRWFASRATSSRDSRWSATPAVQCPGGRVRVH